MIQTKVIHRNGIFSLATHCRCALSSVSPALAQSLLQSRKSHNSLLRHRPSVQTQTRKTSVLSTRYSTTSSNNTPATPMITEKDRFPPYQPPTTGFLSILPASFVPYAELARLDKPIGAIYLFLPCLFSTLLAAPLASTIPPPTTILTTSLLFAAGAFTMRSAGCTINDLWDRNLDPMVRRTTNRPLARRALTLLSAMTFLSAQLSLGLSILLSFPNTVQCMLYAIPSLIPVILYPLAKRVTNYPQVALGTAFSWGAIMGFPALGVDLLANSTAMTAAGLLYASNIAWTVCYDMIYAHMDIKDDKKAGIKSIALAHASNTKLVLSGLAATQISLLVAAGVVAGSGMPFFVGVGGAAMGLGLMIRKVRLERVESCWWWFVNGAWVVSGALVGGLGVDYLGKYLEQEKKRKEKEGVVVESVE